MLDLLKDVKIVRVKNAVAAGQDDTQDGNVIDLVGYDGICFVASFGAITTGAVTDIRVQESDAVAMGDAVDLAGTKVSIADGQDNGVVALNIYRPLKRYIRLRITRATEDAVIDGVIALLYNGKKLPVVVDATLVNSVSVISPIAGTA